MWSSPCSCVGDDEAECVIFGLGDRGRLLGMRCRLVELSLLRQAECQPHAREDRREAGQPEGFPPEVAVEERHVALESVSRFRVVTE